MSLLLSLVLLASPGALRAEPASLTLGKDAEARIEVLATGDDGAPRPDAKVRLSSNVGELGPVTALGGGTFRARFTPPTQHFPQVALILAEIDAPGLSRRLWLALPLRATATLDIDTKPGAKVHVTIAGATLPAATAHADGKVSLPAVVPPGVTSATVRAVDRAGNVTEKPLALPVVPFARARAVADRDGVSWSDGKPLALEVFAVSADGAPVEQPDFTASVDSGSLTPLRALGGGRFALEYTPPQKFPGEAATLTLEAPGAAPVKQPIPLRPGPMASVEVKLEPAEYVAGSGAPVKVHATVVDAQGNPVRDAAPALRAEAGALNGTELRVPDSFDGKRELVVHASIGAASGDGVLKLVGGPPAAANLSMPSGRVPAGGALPVQVDLRDAYGNPAQGAPLSANADRGTVGPAHEVEPGRYALEYHPGDDAEPGPATLTVSAGTAVARKEELLVLPKSRAWTRSVGLLVSAGSNLSKATSARPRLEGALQLGGSPIEGFADLEYAYIAPFTQPYDGVGQNVSLQASAHGLAAELGLRGELELSRLISLQASAEAGPMRLSSTLKIVGGPADGVSQPEDRWGLLARAAGGISARLGPGRALVQAEYAQTSGSWQISGNLGGLALAAGYLASF